MRGLQNDHDMDVVFRISEEKKQIKYSRSEVRESGIGVLYRSTCLTLTMLYCTIV